MLNNSLTQIVLLHRSDNYNLSCSRFEELQKDFTTEDPLFRKFSNEIEEHSMQLGFPEIAFKRDVWDGIPFQINRDLTRMKPSMRWIYQIYIKFRQALIKKETNIDKLFDEIKTGMKEIESVSSEEIESCLDGISSKYNTAAYNKARESIRIAKEKQILKDEGYAFITEQQLINFVLKSPRGLVFEELGRYEKMLPKDVIDALNKAEMLKLFSNYYVLRYDGNNKNIFFVNDSSPKPKDPILFGVIPDCTDLFHIASWIEGDDDLTFDKILSHINLII